MKCPNCGSDLVPLVAGIMQCPKCKKIVKQKVEKKEEVKTKSQFETGEWFMKNTAINKKWEIAEKGLIIDKAKKNMLAAVICHNPNLLGDKYIRISWFKQSINLHQGMLKINQSAELDNLIKVLEKVYDEFDEDFNRIKKKNQKKKIEDESDDDSLEEFFQFDGKTCPKCGSKMKKNKNHKYLTCEICGEIVVLEDGNPIFDIPTEKLPLSYSGNFPVNYYMPAIGITFKWLMAEWKALVIIYAKENPDKRWIRLYWWNRNLQDYISSDYRMDAGSASALAWSAKKGAGSTNIYDKEILLKLADGLKILKKEIGW